MNWQLLIVVQAFLVALATIATRHLARDKRTAHLGLAISAGWFIVLYVVGLALLPFFGDVSLSNFIEYLPRFALGGLAFATSNILAYKMLVYLDAAVGTLLSTVNALFTIVAAAIILKEDLNSIQIIGSICLLISIVYGVLASRVKPNKKTHKNLINGALFAVGAGIFYAIAAVNEKSLLAHVSVGDYLAFGWAWQAALAILGAILIAPKTIKKVLVPRLIFWMVCLGATRAVSGVCFIVALVRSNNVALVTVVSNFRLIIVVLLGVWLLHEHQKLRQKLIATTAATLSLSLLFWR